MTPEQNQAAEADKPKRRGRPKKAQEQGNVEKAAAEFMEAEKKAEPKATPAAPAEATAPASKATPVTEGAAAVVAAAPTENKGQNPQQGQGNAQQQGQNQNGQQQGQNNQNRGNQGQQNNPNNQGGQGNNKFNNNKFNKFNKFKNRHGKNLPQDDFLDESIQLPPPDPEKVAAARAKWRELRGLPMFELQRQADELSIPDFKTMRKQALVYSILSATTGEDCPIYTEGVLEIIPDGGHGFLRNPDHN